MFVGNPMTAASSSRCLSSSSAPKRWIITAPTRQVVQPPRLPSGLRYPRTQSAMSIPMLPSRAADTARRSAAAIRSAADDVFVRASSLVVFGALRFVTIFAASRALVGPVSAVGVGLVACRPGAERVGARART